MRYFVRMDDGVDSKTFNQPMSLHRFQEPPNMIVERWDVKTSKWVDNPNLIRVFGVGGDTDYIEVQESNVSRLKELLSESNNN